MEHKFGKQYWEYSSHYTGDRPRYQQALYVRRGRREWNEFVDATGIEDYPVIAAFDMHDVIDTLTHDQSMELGVDLEHGYVPFGLMSKGKKHNDEVWDCRQKPFIYESDFIVFTRQSCNEYNGVDVYRESNWPDNCIRISGDKGSISRLLDRPVLLFDDKEENIDALPPRSEGLVVRRGRRFRHWADPGYTRTWDVVRWPSLVANFGRKFERIIDP